MRTPLTACLVLALGVMAPISASLSVPPEDLEGSGYDLEGSGSGSGDGSGEGEIKDMEVQVSSKDGRIFVVNADDGSKNSFHGSSDLTFDRESGFVIVSNSQSFMETKDVLAAVIAGGVAGVTVAAAVAAILIYKWQKKDEDRTILG